MLVGLDFWLWLVRFGQWWRLFVHSFDFLWKVVIVIEGCWWVSIFGCSCGFPVHSFGFFVWLLVVLMVVESVFVVGGGDETGFGCGFHVLRVKSCRKGKKTVEKD